MSKLGGKSPMKIQVEMGTLERVSRARHKILAQFDHEPEKLIRYYMALQQDYKDRFADLNKRHEHPKQPVVETEQ